MNFIHELIKSLRELAHEESTGCYYAAVVVLTGCEKNAIRVFGKDVSKAGEAVSDTAQKLEKKI